MSNLSIKTPSVGKLSLPTHRKRPQQVVIDIGFHAGQKQIVNLYDLHRYFVCCMGRRWGKTVGLANLCILKLQNKGFKIGYAVPTYDKIQRVWELINEKLARLIKTNSKQEKCIELNNKSSITFLTLDTPGKFRQYEFDLVIVDEAAMVRDLEYKWNYEIKPTLINRSGKCFFISTPQGNTSYFSKLFLYAQSGDNKDWISFSGPTFDNPTIPAEELIQLRSGDRNDPAYCQEILAQIVPGSGHPFGDFTSCIIDDLLITDKTVVCYGLDVASKADNTAIIGFNNSNQVVYVDCFKDNWVNIKRRIAEIIGQTPTLLDTTGVGQVLYDELSALKAHNLEGFLFTHQSKQELIQQLAAGLKNKLLWLPQGAKQLINEMSEYEYEYKNGSLFMGTQVGHDDLPTALALGWRKKNHNYLPKISDFFYKQTTLRF